MEWCEEGRVHEGLEHFIRTVELAETTNAHDLARVARVNIAAWPRELPNARRAFPHAQQPRLAAFHPDGKHMVTVGRGSTIHLWDTNSGARSAPTNLSFRRLSSWLPVSHTGPWLSATTGETIAAGSSDGQITVWNTDSPEPRPRNSTHVDVDEKRLGSRLRAGRHSLGQRRPQRNQAVEVSGPEAEAHRAGVPSSRALDRILQVLAISRDGKRLYSGDRAGIIREWDGGTA